MAGTVELATIWLVDLVGSTRLATAVGPVRADSLRDEYFALLCDAIDASGGREFKNTGDGLFVAFSSASAAVSCAALTQQLFERRYRSAEQALHVRIGLGTGESTVRDGDYFGMPSIEAARGSRRRGGSRASTWNGGVSFGHARTYSAMLAATLGRHEHADADFAFACEVHHRHGVHAWEARAELGWAEALAERGELAAAREHASRALELARDHGYGAFEPRAAAIVASRAAMHP